MSELLKPLAIPRYAAVGRTGNNLTCPPISTKVSLLPGSKCIDSRNGAGITIWNLDETVTVLECISMTFR